jgi:hypothetical protein
MAILTTKEIEFLHVFLYEATTEPFFNGPASKALHGIGVYYTDISYMNWAYAHEVPRTSHIWGHPADVSPPLPWPDRETALRRNKEIEQIWKQQHPQAVVNVL